MCIAKTYGMALFETLNLLHMQKYTLPVECSIANDDVSGNFCAAFKSLDIRVIHIVRIFEAGTHCKFEISFMIILLIQISLALKKNVSGELQLSIKYKSILDYHKLKTSNTL